MIFRKTESETDDSALRQLAYNNGRFSSLAYSIDECLDRKFGVLTDVSLKDVLEHDPEFLKGWLPTGQDAVDHTVDAVVFSLDTPNDVVGIFIDEDEWNYEERIAIKEICGFYGSFLIILRPQQEYSIHAIRMAFIDANQELPTALTRMASCPVCQASLSFATSPYTRPTLYCGGCGKYELNFEAFAERLDAITSSAFSRFSEKLEHFRESAHGTPMPIRKPLAEYYKGSFAHQASDLRSVAS